MNTKLHNIILSYSVHVKAEQGSVDLHHFNFRIRQMQQTLARQRSLLAHYRERLACVRKGLQKIQSRLDSIAA